MNNGLVIARGGLNLRKSPKTGKVVDTLRRGSKLEILEEETWLKVRDRRGQEGYVLADFVEREDAEPVVNTGIPVDTAVDAVLALADTESDECEIRPYVNSQFIGKELKADVDFMPHLDRLNQYAAECGVQIHVTSSAREQGSGVSGAIVTPAGRSNHLVGHAIDMNLKSASGFFNSSKLKRSNFDNLPGEIKDLLNRIKEDKVLRWGGEFSQEDPVHIDDDLNHRNPGRWDRKLASRRQAASR